MKSLRAPLSPGASRSAEKAATRERRAAGEMGFNRPLLAFGYFNVHPLVMPV